MVKCLISVVIPVYNVEAYLDRCIKSVLNQTYDNLQIILVDDGSKDESGKICENYMKIDSRILVIHQENQGLSGARNTGIKSAKGDYITFIDSDDYIENDYIEYLFDLATKYNAEISICTHRAIYETGLELSRESDKEFVMNKEEALKNMLYYQDFDVSAWAKLYEKDLFKNVCFPIRRYYEDAATTYKLIDLSNKIAFGGQSKYNYMIRNNSIVNNNNYKSKLDLIKSTEEMCGYINENYPNLKQASKRRLVYANLSTLRQIIDYDDNQSDVKKIINTVRNTGVSLLFYNDVHIRDKFGIISCLFGNEMFKYSWKLYEKISKRKG